MFPSEIVDILTAEPATPSEAKSFTQLMNGVVFVLSGFQNPYRSQLRDQALEMGAKYRPDWGRDCTHLVYVGSLWSLSVSLCW